MSATLVLADGFNDYNGTGTGTGLQSKWTASATTGLSLVADPWTPSGQALQWASRTSTPSEYVARAFPAAYGSFTVGFHVNTNTPGSLQTNALTWQQVVFTKTGTPVFGFVVTQSGAVAVVRATGVLTQSPTFLATSASGIITGGTNHFIEIVCSAISDTVGAVDVYVDGTRVINATGLDNKAGSDTTVDGLAIVRTGAVNTSVTQTYDDLYVDSGTTPLGPCRVETLAPTADTAQKDFTPNSGATNYTQVDEALANGDTDYVQAGTVGNTDRYTFAALSNVPTTIHGIVVSSFAEKTDAGSRSIALQVKSGGTTQDGGNFALATSYGKQERVVTVDPNTSAAWTGAAVNAIEAGPKVTV